MNAETLIRDFRRRGIRLIPNPPKLSVEPASRLTNDDRQAIRQHIAAILPRLAAAHSEQAEIERISRLDAERREADRVTRRGYDFDPTAASHKDYLKAPPTLAIKGAPHWTPAHNLLARCQRHGVALRIDLDGTLVVGKAGAKAEEPTQPWPTLIRAIEAHLEAVAELVASGWSLQADFPQMKGAA